MTGSLAPESRLTLPDRDAGQTGDVMLATKSVCQRYQPQHAGRAQLVGPAFQREAYAIALVPESPLAEQFNRALLALRENGRYDQICCIWSGEAR